jgi:predicted permease
MAPDLHEFLSRVKSLFRKRQMDREMADELEIHQALLREKLLRQGVPHPEVELAARRAFGNARRWHERLRELWQFQWLENLLRDVRFSWRLLLKSRAFSIVALLTLALGVGANTTVFSMINGLLLRPLPVPESDRLAVLGIIQGRPQPNYSFPEPIFRAFEHRHEVFEDVFAFSRREFEVRRGTASEEILGQYVSGSFFAALRTAPLMGRVLTPADDRPGGDPAGFGVVISEGFWQTWFSGAPDVIGQKLTIDNTVFTVVGVMPKPFIGADPMLRPQLYAPLATEVVLDGARSMTVAGYHGWWLTVMGRLQPGATLEQADAQVSSATVAVLHERISDEKWIAARLAKHFRFTAESGSAGFTYIRMQFKNPLVAVFAMCGGILLLACMNLASLLTARAAARQRELATRAAMGATRGRIVQQLLVESLLIAVIGTAAGLAIAPLVSRSLAALLLSGTPHATLDTSLDVRVFGLAALAAIVSTLLVGLLPALQATSRNLNDPIKDSQHTTRARERRIVPRVLMSAEVGLALLLVVGAGLIATSLLRLYTSGEGFDPKGVENIAFSMDKQNLKGDALIEFYHDLGDGLSRQPGVTVASFARMIPLSGNEWDQEISGSEAKGFDTFLNSVGPGYFAAMRIPILEGRDYNWHDTTASGLKIVLNQTAARQLFPDGSALGRTVKKREGDKMIEYTVIGVVGDAKYEDLRSSPPAAAYEAMTQDDGHSPSYNAVVRTAGPPAPLAGAARALASRFAPGIPAPEMTSMEKVVDDSLSAERMMALLSVFFAGCALVVTAIGLYGTLAYATARRTSEIGIRIALGAQRRQVVGMVFLENSAVAISGTAAGLIAALLASRALASFLFETSPRDPWVIVGSVAALAAIASAASVLPALRAARIEPMAAIRCE